MTLDDELARILAARDRDNMQGTIDALLPIYEQHPDNARVLYEVGGAYDTAGDEEVARSFYERALATGLSGDLLRRCYLQYASTLRNLGSHAHSLRVLVVARRTFPESPSLAAFEAVSLHAAGRPDEAVACLLELVADAVDSPELERYKPALRENAECIRSRATVAPPNSDRT